MPIKGEDTALEYVGGYEPLHNLLTGNDLFKYMRKPDGTHWHPEYKALQDNRARFVNERPSHSPKDFMPEFKEQLRSQTRSLGEAEMKKWREEDPEGFNDFVEQRTQKLQEAMEAELIHEMEYREIMNRRRKEANPNAKDLTDEEFKGKLEKRLGPEGSFGARGVKRSLASGE
jgi:hypothetical protein